MALLPQRPGPLCISCRVYFYSCPKYMRAHAFAIFFFFREAYVILCTLHYAFNTPLQMGNKTSSLQAVPFMLRHRGCLPTEHAPCHGTLCVTYLLHVSPASYWIRVPTNTKIMTSCYNNLCKTSQVACLMAISLLPYNN